MKWILAVVLLALSGAAVGATVDIPSGAGVDRVGVNLFEILHFDEAVVTGHRVETNTGPNSSLSLTARLETVRAGPEDTFQAEVRVPYNAPLPAHHMHVRFAYDAEFGRAGPGVQPPFTQSLRIEGLNGEQFDRVSLDPADLERGNEPDRPTESWWYQDPGAVVFPLRPVSGAPLTGTLVWQVQEELGQADFSGVLVPDMITQGTVNVTLWSDSYPVDGFAPGDRASFSHMEYSFVELDGMRVERHRTERDGNLHAETWFIVDLPEDILEDYEASIQLDMEPGMVFSRIELPDGSTRSDFAGLSVRDWRALLPETVYVEALGVEEQRSQVTLPMSMVHRYGAGQYILVVEDPTATIPAGGTLGSAFVVVAFAATGLAGAWSLRMAGMLVRGAEGSYRRLARRLLRVAFIGTVTFAFLLLTITAMGTWPVLLLAPAATAMAPIWLVLALLAGAFIIVSVLGGRGAQGDILEALQGERQTKKELERSNEALEQFAYLASHDLQAPLRTMAGYTGLLKHQYGKDLPPEAVELLEEAERGALSMQSMVDSLLAFARVGSHDHPHVAVRLTSVVEDSCKRLQAAIDGSKASISIGALPVVRGDKDLLIQLFQNLLSNAIRYRHPERTPEIVVSSTSSKRLVRITVDDNGRGIPAGKHDKVFQMFQRLDSTTEGTGIGLSLCRRIVERHRGKIWAEPLQEGTRVVIELPLG